MIHDFFFQQIESILTSRGVTSSNKRSNFNEISLFISNNLSADSTFCFSPTNRFYKTTFNEIVVTATKTETPYYAIGSSVSVITSKEISERQLKTVVDVLREEPGLSIIEQGGPGKLANVFMRGANSNHTLVIVDGVTMNDASSPNNAFDFSSMNTNDVDRIEIVRGPQSTLYGSDALAGIINIITKHGSNTPEYSFASEGGTNGYYRGNISALGSTGILRYAIIAIKRGLTEFPRVISNLVTKKRMVIKIILSLPVSDWIFLLKQNSILYINFLKQKPHWIKVKNMEMIQTIRIILKNIFLKAGSKQHLSVICGGNNLVLR